MQAPWLTLERCEDRGETGGGDNEGACGVDKGDGDVGTRGRTGIATGDNIDWVLGAAARSGEQAGN